jgi:outer membrane lipoprotein-sorting protein
MNPTKPANPMTCADVRDRFVDYADGLLDEPVAAEMRAHLDACDACQTQWQHVAALHARLLRDAQQPGQLSLPDLVMDQILRETTLKLRKHAMFKRYLRISLGLSTADAAVIVIALFLTGVLTSAPAVAAEVIADGAKAVAKVTSVHIKANMRTLPADNFELIGVNYDFIPHDLWWHSGTPPQWRVEKPGRVVVMDGKESLLWVRPANMAAKAGIKNGFVGWIQSLLDVKGILDRELDNAKKHAWKMTNREEAAKDGHNQLVVTVEAKALGDFANPAMKNRSILESDNTRVWRFDADTKLLRALQIIVHDDKRDVTVFEITDIQYDQDLPPTLFALDLPKDVTWIGQLPPGAEKLTSLSPKEVAQAFFQACADKDWQKFRQLMPVEATDGIKNYMGGLKVVCIGEPFKSGLYGGWFVPYEVKLANGETKKHNLAVRNDNPQKLWMVDGGF